MLSHSLANGAELRLLEYQHAEELFALMGQSREFLRQWLPEWDAQKSLDDCKALIKSSLQQLTANGGFTLGIWWKGCLAGIIGAGNIDWENRSTLIGYWLGESYQGKGLMTGACRAMIDYLFFELKLHRIEIRCATSNPKSCAVPKRLGFSKEGVLRQAQAVDDHFLDTEVYGLLAEDWNRFLLSHPEEDLLPIEEIQEQPHSENHATTPDQGFDLANHWQETVQEDLGDDPKIKEPVD